MTIERVIYLSCIAILLFILGMLYTYECNVFSSTEYSADINLNDGTYLRFVFIGSPQCSFSNNERVHEMVKFLKNEIRSIAKEHTVNFISTGISNNMSSQTGVNYLKNTGPYNEVVAGASSYNLGVIQYSPGVTETPQIVMIREQHDTNLIGLNINNLNKAQYWINSYNGKDEIEAFYNFIQGSTHQEILDRFGI